MNGRRLYDHHVDALKETARSRYRNGEYTRTYPAVAPVAWPFLTLNEKQTWDDLAKRITPKPKKR